VNKKFKILILGSEGFIGSHLVTYFEALKYEVTKADIVLRQARNYLLINPESPNFAGIFMQQKFEACINATGAANVQLSFDYPGMDYNLNTSNVYAILDSIRQYNPGCKFINLSSAAVYGNPSSLPISEEAKLRPVSPYGYHKMYSEDICKQFHDLFNIPTISLRIFSAYGEGLKKQLFWDLYKKINSTGKDIELFGTGAESRDFIYIGDIMQAIECILNKAVFNGGAINVATGVESTIRHAVDCFIKSFNRKLEVRFAGNTKIGDPINWQADISLLLSLGFQQEFTIEQGINNYVEWVQGKRSL
jgi:UDP-glucose 4-epimerase